MSKTPFKNVNDLEAGANKGTPSGSEAGNSPASGATSSSSNTQAKADEPLFENAETVTTETSVVEPPKPESVLVQEMIRAFKAIGEQQTQNTSSSQELISALTSAMEKQGAKNRGGADGVVLSPDEVAAQYSADDVLDKPVIFFRVCGNRYVDMGGPGVDGTLKLPPYRDQYNKPVPMIWEPGPVVDGGFGMKGERIQTRYAQYVCKSKKELDYIRNHRDFGTVIQEEAISQGFTVNAFVMAMSNASKKVNHMNQVDRIMFARDRGIDVDNLEPQEWYRQLVVTLAQEESQSQSIVLGNAKSMFDSLMQTVEHPGSRGVTHAGITKLGGMDGVLAIHRQVEVTQ